MLNKWFNSELKAALNGSFQAGQTVFTKMTSENCVIVYNGSYAHTALQLTEAQLCLDSTRNSAGKVIYLDAQEAATVDNRFRKHVGG